MNHRSALGCLAAAMLAVRIFSAAAADFGGEVLSNADIIGLSRAGVRQDVILAKIQSSANSFDVSSRGLITLKENGIPDELINSMMAAAQSLAARPALDHARFTRELENVAGEIPEDRTAGIAWIVANREQSLPALRQALASPRPEIRMAALTVFARQPDRDSLPAIRNLLTDPIAAVRAAAARTLVELGDAASIPPAEQAVARQLDPLDGYARLLGHARETRAAGSLGNVVSTNASSLNRIAAIWALGEIGRAGVAGRPALERALASDSDPEVRREAARAVAKFHDAAGARLLQDACRTDPEVRKITLAAMGEYPESVEFLVGVINLGPDQIAADEVETARNSLRRLTGQDFGLDGPRWLEWFAQNRSGFAAADIPAFGGIPPSGVSTGQSAAPLSAAPTADGRSAAPGQVDLEAWSIVADSSAIPMAPMPQAQSASAAPGWPAPPPGMSSAPAWQANTPASASEPPMFVSPGDFEDAPGQFGGPSSPFADSQASTTPAFRTWSSEPERAIPPPGAPATASGSTAGATPSAGEGNVWSSGDSFESFNPPSASGETAFDAGASAASLPESASVPSAAAPLRPAPEPPAPPSGISLPLPGMAASPAPEPDYAESSLTPSPGQSVQSLFDAPDDMFTSAVLNPAESASAAPPAAAAVESAADASPFGDASWDAFDASAHDAMFDGSMSGAGLFEPPPDDAPAAPATDPYAGLESSGALGMPESPAQPFEAPADSDSAGGEDASAFFSGAGEAFMTPPVESGDEPASAGIFVEPEPGQQVIGEPLFGPGSPPSPVESAVHGASDLGEQWLDGSEAESAEPPPQVVAPTYEAGPATTAPAIAVPSRPAAAGPPSHIDTRFITPGAGEPAEEEQPRRRGLFGRRQPERRAPQATGDLPPDYVVTPPPPQQQPTSPETGGDYFSDPSVPLPPVQNSGIITGGQGENPPMLGEGFF